MNTVNQEAIPPTGRHRRQSVSCRTRNRDGLDRESCTVGETESRDNVMRLEGMEESGWRHDARVNDQRHQPSEDRSVNAGMKLRSLIPVLDVRDVETSIDFYCGVLGFTLQDKVEWGGRMEWALLRSDHVQLMLCAAQDAEVEEAVRREEGVFFLYHDDPEAFLVHLGSRGYEQPADMFGLSEGRRDFFMRDPDGYVLWFSHKPVVKDGEDNKPKTATDQDVG